MTQCITFIIDMVAQILDVLREVTFDVGPFTVSLLSIFLGVIVISMCISVFWKGAQD